MTDKYWVTSIRFAQLAFGGYSFWNGFSLSNFLFRNKDHSHSVVFCTLEKNSLGLLSQKLFNLETCSFTPLQRGCGVQRIKYFTESKVCLKNNFLIELNEIWTCLFGGRWVLRTYPHPTTYSQHNRTRSVPQAGSRVVEVSSCSTALSPVASLFAPYT